ncbi:MAG: T9SS type A sorting domain-containing protein [Bacteroidetes bacterium]|nr:T9SS type A sorting domain-containing protein [Bacteroidota bacterium]
MGNKINLTVFLNPSTDLVNFSIENRSANEIYTLRIDNAFGQMVKTVYFSASANSFVINDLSPGAYFYTLKTANSGLIQGKFMILTNSSK